MTNHKLTLYSRQDCCLCDAMKAVIRELAVTVPLELEVIDIDDSAALREKFGNEIPVLLVDGRKAFKYRVTKEELERQLGREVRRKPLFRFSK